MSTATRTTTARKAMRAATVFTGAAGLAFGFWPTAMAAARPAPAQGHSARATGATPANIQLTAADIKGENCTTNTWLHISHTSEWSGRYCTQFGGTGFTAVNAAASGFGQCGGNNYGEVWYEAAAGDYKAIPYGPGTTYRQLPGAASYVSISHWKGTDKCPWPR
jgi:hypothetical protein